MKYIKKFAFFVGLSFHWILFAILFTITVWVVGSGAPSVARFLEQMWMLQIYAVFLYKSCVQALTKSCSPVVQWTSLMIPP